MKRDEYIKLSREKARKVLSAEDYKKLRAAAKTKSYVFFRYTDKEGVKAIYRAVRPKEFFFTPGWGKPPGEGAVYMWSYHLLHKRNHSFRADRIKKVNYWPTIIDALTDPQKNKIYWQGETASIKTTIL